MSQSELLLLKQSIEKMALPELADAIDLRHHYLDRVEDFEDDLARPLRYSLDHAYRHISNSCEKARESLIEIDQAIADGAFELIREDNIYWNAEHGTRFKTAEFQRKFQQLKLSTDTVTAVRARIGLYVDWRFPGLEIGPGDGEWTRQLVACDPLYLVDYNIEFLASSKKQFNEKYQPRMRLYTNRGEGLNMLPQHQFGFIFSWNTFNYLSFNQINEYLGDIYKALRPGGACMFSYNNGERSFCAQRAEEKLMSFVPETLLCKVLRKHKFIDIKPSNVDSAVSWIEFRKPGQLRSSRSGQALGKIILTQHAEV